MEPEGRDAPYIARDSGQYNSGSVLIYKSFQLSARGFSGWPPVLAAGSRISRLARSNLGFGRITGQQDIQFLIGNTIFVLSMLSPDEAHPQFRSCYLGTHIQIPWLLQ